MRVFGVAGWKDTGKTTLATALVAGFVARGLRVSSVKHAHHDTDIDHPGRDSFRHREAGAAQVIVSSPRRWAVMTELRDQPEPGLDALLARLDPCDLVLVEGYKFAPHPKIATVRQATGRAISPEALCATLPNLRAIASDVPLDTDLPCFDLNDIAGISAFVLREVGL